MYGTLRRELGADCLDRNQRIRKKQEKVASAVSTIFGQINYMLDRADNKTTRHIYRKGTGARKGSKPFCGVTIIGSCK